MSTSRWIALAVVAPLAGACATAPEPAVDGPRSTFAITADRIAGDYDLVSYGDEPLPFTTERDRVTDCVEEVTQGRLTLATDGTWSFVYIERDLCEGEYSEEETERVGGSFDVRDGRIHFDEQWGEDGPEGDGSREVRDFDFGWLENGNLLIQPEGIRGIALVFQH